MAIFSFLKFSEKKKAVLLKSPLTDGASYQTVHFTVLGHSERQHEDTCSSGNGAGNQHNFQYVVTYCTVIDSGQAKFMCRDAREHQL
jgi:hypothetical protein